MELKLTETEEKNLLDEANKTKEEEKKEPKSKEQEEFELIIQKRITKRIKRFQDTLGEILGNEFEFIVAGNSLNKDIPNDYDLYANGNFEFDFEEIEKQIEDDELGEILDETRNALTVKIDDTVVQFCKYKKDTLEKLVDSFDFAHIQIGALFKIEDHENTFEERTEHRAIFKKMYASENWTKAKLYETTFYTEPELEDSYPLSSLIRVFKYQERGTFGDGTYTLAVLKILNQILRRGYKTYDDFKDQLSAVDLMVLNKDESDAAWKLYQTCASLNLVKESEVPEDEQRD